jgi:hypothetical protein
MLDPRYIKWAEKSLITFELLTLPHLLEFLHNSEK